MSPGPVVRGLDWARPGEPHQRSFPISPCACPRGICYCSGTDLRSDRCRLYVDRGGFSPKRLMGIRSLSENNNRLERRSSAMVLRQW